MAGRADNQEDLRPWLSRRDFLQVAASITGGCYLSSALGADAPPERLKLPKGVPAPRVVQVASRHACAKGKIHKVLVREMLGQTLTSLTGTDSPSAAWHRLLEPNDVVGLKFNRSAQQALGTSEVVADALITSLLDAGWPARQLVCIEAPAEVARRHATLAPIEGYDTHPTDFGSGNDQFASVLRQVTALIDIPFLKSHNIARLTCCLKNLSHGLIKHPARFHAHECSPYVADIVAADAIRPKLRLCLVDALRIVYDGGPEAYPESVEEAGVLLASRDPVATDAVGLALLNTVRQDHKLTPVAPAPEKVPYLAAAHRRNLGIALLQGIDLIRQSP